MQLQFVKSTLTVNPCMVSDVIFVKHAVSALNLKWESEVVLFYHSLCLTINNSYYWLKDKHRLWLNFICLSVTELLACIASIFIYE